MSLKINLKKSSNSTGIDCNTLKNIIKRCLVEKQSVKSTAVAYGIPRTSLIRYLKKVEEQFDDIEAVCEDDLLDFVSKCGQRVPSNQVFSPAQEEHLITYMLKCGLSINKLREIAYQFAMKLGVDFPDNWNADQMAGRDWYKAFKRRHPKLTLRTPEQTSLNRVEGFCKANVEKFFGQLGALLDDHHFPAACLFNMNESGFSTVPTKIGKVITLKGMKLEGAERDTMITMALTVNASGNSFPPFFLFPKKNMETCFLDNASDGTVGFANGSGWMSQPEFVQYMNHFITFARPTPENPVLLLLDNHDSYLSIEALNMAVENGVHILSFPPHCSHRLQPLDVSVFGPVKAYYKSQCAAWQKNNAKKALEIRHLAGLISETLDIALTPKTIKAGFRATGIAPYDPDIFSDADYVQDAENNEIEVAMGEKGQDCMDCIIPHDPLDVEEVCTTSEPSTSSISRSTSQSSLSILDELRLLHGVTPKKQSNRGRKPMRSSVLTSPEVKDLERLKKLAKEFSTATGAQRPSKRGPTSTPVITPAKGAKISQPFKKQESSDEENEEKCAVLRASSFTCVNSDSDVE